MDAAAAGSSSEGSMATSSDLPEDLVIKILSLLPVKSLLRFRCVCKSWCALFENSSFVSEHISNNTIETTKILVQRRLLNYKDEFLWLSNETLEVSEHLELNYLRERHRRKLNILGSCYGVICLREIWSNDIILWNPSTRQSKVVPEFPITDPPYSEILYTFGFGYDVKINDFRVVRFVTLLYANHIRDEDKRTEVYSLSTDSWRIIDAVPPNNLSTYDRRWTYVNGVLSNLGETSKLKVMTKGEQVLISFDMRDEVFILTPMPELCVKMHDNYSDSQLTTLYESVALFQFMAGVFSYEIWVLNEYGSKGSWTKLYTIQYPDYNYNNPLGFFWKNSVLVVEIANGGLALLDLITREIKNRRVDEELIVLDLISYKESLVPIKGGSHLLQTKRG